MTQVKKALRRAVEEIDREQKTREADQVNREFRQQKLYELLTHGTAMRGLKRNRQARWDFP